MTLSEYVNLKHGMQAELARRSGITPVLIHQWAKGKRPVPAERCRSIAEASDGKVTLQELRPDIFGEADRSDVAISA